MTNQKDVAPVEKDEARPYWANIHAQVFPATDPSAQGEPIAECLTDNAAALVVAALNAYDPHREEVVKKVVEALKKVMTTHCSNDKIFCSACSPAREAISAYESMEER